MNFIEQFLALAQKREMKGAIAFQKNLMGKVLSKRYGKAVKSICAFDISYEKSSNTNYASAVIMSYPDLELLEERYKIEQASFPYVPGLLAFREGPAIIRLYNQLQIIPDMLLFDGQGLAHPRGMGIASLIGLLLGKPSIGCAKSRLIGEYTEPGRSRGDFSNLATDGKIIGRVLRTRAEVKPFFVSVGHLVDLDQASEIVLTCCRRYRLPEPIRAAHSLANDVRKRESK